MDINWAEVNKYREPINGVEWGEVLATYIADEDLYTEGHIGGTTYLVKDLAGTAVEGWFYDFTNLLFTAVDPGGEAPRREITAMEFWFESFTTRERAMTWALCDDHPNVREHDDSPLSKPSVENLYRLTAFRDLTVSGKFFLDQSEVVAVVGALEQIGLLAPGRADAILERV